MFEIMFTNLAIATIVFPFTSILFLCYYVQGLRHNIAEAKSSGFKYVIVPCFFLSAPWAIAQPVLLPLLYSLPKTWTESWLPLILSARTWHYGYKPFSTIGADTFMAVSSSQNVLYTCDPEATTQLFRDKAIGKPSELYKILNIFGPTMTGTDGQEARLYRTITAPFFNEYALRQVWSTSIMSTEKLLRILVKVDVSGCHQNLRQSLARMTLHILNKVCFENNQDCLDVLQLQEEISPGHELSYSEAMHCTLNHFDTIFGTPPFILNSSPFRAHRNARQAYSELYKYLEELRDRKKSEINPEGRMMEISLLDLIVGAGEMPNKHSNALLSPRAVLGNIFIFMFAGHEASANTLAFLIVLLACHPQVQKSLQNDIDRILGSRLASQWSMERDYSLLMESHVGAVINETLRLYTVLPFIPKTVLDSPYPININDQAYIIPANTLVLINTSAAHRHPNHWPELSRQTQAKDSLNPVAEFSPRRWLVQNADKSRTEFLRPKPGSFIPFSDGSRGCLGRRFALVELCGVVTRIFSEYSVELVMEEEREGLGSTASKEQRNLAWEKAKGLAEQMMSSGIEFRTALRMSGNVPVKFVKKGRECFAECKAEAPAT